MPAARSPARAIVVAYLLFLQFFYSWAWSSSGVLRPLFRTLYGLSLAEAGSAYSAQVVGALAGGLATGWVEHHVGRKATLALIGCGCGAAFGAGALVDGLASLAAQRFILGLFMGAVFPATIGVLVDLFPARQRGRLASLVDATYFAAVIALGWGLAAVSGTEWPLLFWPVGAALAIVGLLAFALALPRHAADRADAVPRVRELLSPGLRRQTIALAAMVSANACGHQAFVGWMTVYLVEVGRVSDEAVAATLSAQYMGSIIGCFAWGYVADRFGRRTGGRGLIGSALFVLLFLVLPGPLWLRQIAVFGYGFSFAAVVTIGPWLAELYPPHMRAPATSIFQWGRFVSLFAPPLTGIFAVMLGLPLVMALAALAFLSAGLIWRRLPETHWNG